MRRIEPVILVVTMLSFWLGACDDSRIQDISRIPASVRITVNPPNDVFNVGQQVNLGYVVLDENGIVVDGVEASWQVPSADHVSESMVNKGQYTFLQPGSFTWSVTLTLYPSISDSVTLAAKATPADVEITVDPEKDFYAVGDEVTLGYIVRDPDGNELHDIGATWQNPDAAQVQSLGQGKFKFSQAGAFTWTVTLDQPWGASDSVTLIVDSSSPSIVVESPERGDTILKETADASVSVSGSVTDDISGLAALTVRTQEGNPVDVTVQANGAFSVLMPVQTGVNTVVLHAEDLAGNSSEVTRSFVYAPAFFSPEDDPQAMVANMEDVLITDRALDKGQPPSFDPCSHGADDAYHCNGIQDIASLLELALNSIDFASMHDPLSFHFPLVEQDLGTVDLAGFATVSLRLEGFFDLDFAYSDISAGEAKVTDLSSTDAGIRSDVAFESWTDSNGTEHAGLTTNLGMTGTLQFLVWLDLTTSDPNNQALLCALAQNICNPDPPFDCLDEYIESCRAVPTPAGSMVSVISTPVLAGLDIGSMTMQSDIIIGLNQSTHEPRASLGGLDINLSQGALDVSALEDLTIELGSIHFASYEIANLGTYHFDATFISDLVDAVLDPLVDALIPIIEPTLENIMGCRDPNNPACFVLPMFEDLLASFSFDDDISIPDPFDNAQDAPALAEFAFNTRLDDILFRTGFGGKLTMSGRVSAAMSQEVDNHRDDDNLGVGLLSGCLDTDTGFGGYPTNSKAIQLANAVDMVNQIMYAVWAAGGLDLSLQQSQLDLSDQADVTDLSIELKPWLPVVLHSCSESESDVSTAWGDVHFDVSFMENGKHVQASGFASLELDGQLEVDQDQVPDLNTDTQAAWSEMELESLLVDGQMDSFSGAEAQKVKDLVTSEVLTQVISRVERVCVNQLGRFIPAYDISSFPGVDPAESELDIGDLDAQEAQGRIILNGEFTQ